MGGCLMFSLRYSISRQMFTTSSLESLRKPLAKPSRPLP